MAKVMNHLIDGYNLLHAVGRLSPRSTREALEGARRWLFVHLRPIAVPPTGITVVFDSKNNAPGARSQELASGVCFLFSQGETADDLIETLIDTDPHPKNLLVVSDDHRLKQAARHGRCQSIGCLDYYERFLQPQPVMDEKREAPDTSAVKPEDVSSDEVKHWLELFGEDEDDLKKWRR